MPVFEPASSEAWCYCNVLSASNKWKRITSAISSISSRHAKAKNPLDTNKKPRTHNWWTIKLNSYIDIIFWDVNQTNLYFRYPNAFPLDQAKNWYPPLRLGEWRSAAQLLEKTDAVQNLATAVAYYEQVRVGVPSMAMQQEPIKIAGTDSIYFWPIF